MDNNKTHKDGYKDCTEGVGDTEVKEFDVVCEDNHLKLE